jgi:DNA-binding NarL/FixJ family response regulator
MEYVHGKSIIKIAFADDDELLQDLLTPYIDSIENCKVVIQAFNGRELLEKLALKPDTNLILLDIKMPLMDGIQAAKKIKEQYPEMKILFSSIYKNEIVYYRIIDAGEDGYINKNSTAPEFKRAILNIMKSGSYFQNYSNRFNNEIGKNIKVVFDEKNSISAEEIVFMKLVCTNKTYENIASEMHTNLRHIDYIRQGLFEKFEIHSRAELALFAYNGGI